VATERSGGDGVVSRLYRLKWWIGVPLCTLLFLVLPFYGPDGLTWVVAVLLAALVWVPILAAWWRGGRRAGAAFREGLDGR
jgi:hypothetical protein